MLYLEKRSDSIIPDQEIREELNSVFSNLKIKGKALAIPPDFTRYHSHAGEITGMIYKYYGNRLTDILPALGTHSPMKGEQIRKMFRGIPESLFRAHNWREELHTLGVVPAEFVRQVSENKADFNWPAQVNKLLVDGGFDVIFSIGQVVPHEVIGMANYNKNIFVGTGGVEGINKSHYLGALCGMEQIMGRADNPVRQVLNYASENFAMDLPIIYILTAIGKDSEGNTGVKGLFIGDDQECFTKAADLSFKLNITMVEEPLKKVIVYLDSSEFKSTWLGNKSIYRTRVAIADGGDLIVLAPGIKEFGEDREIDRLIRKYGYKTSEEILEYTKYNKELQDNLSAAAHLIHGSSENRFNIIYCPGDLSEEEILSVNYQYADLQSMLKKYNPDELIEGFNTIDGEEIYFISNPALGLWAHKDRF